MQALRELSCPAHAEPIQGDTTKGIRYITEISVAGVAEAAMSEADEVAAR